MPSLNRKDMLQRFLVLMLRGSTYKMTEMMGWFSLSCYHDKITDPRHVQNIKLSKNR